jgi:hypothetical protein
VRWVCLINAAALLALAGLVWWAFRHQDTVVRGILKNVPLPATIEFESFKADENGVTITALQLHHPESKAHWLTLPKIKWTPDWRQMATGHFGAVEISDAKVEIDSAWLSSSTTDVAAPVSAASPLRFKSVSFTNTQIKIPATAGNPALEFTLDQTGEDIDLTDLARPHFGKFSSTVTHLKLGANDFTLPALHVQGSLNRETGELHLERASIASTSIRPSPVLSQLLRKVLDVPSGQASAEPGMIRRLRIDRLQLNEVTLDTTDVATRPEGWPAVTARTSLTLNDIQWTPGQPLHLGPQTLQLDEVRFRPPQGQGEINLNALHLQITGIDSQGLLRVSNLRLVRPMVRWTAALEDWLMTIATSSTGSSSTAAPWINGAVIDKANIVDADLATTRTSRIGYQASALGQLQLQSLHISPTGIRSGSAQSLQLSAVQIAEHPSHKGAPLPPLLTLASAKLSVIPDHFTETHRITSLELDAPIIRFTPETTSASSEYGTPTTNKPFPIFESLTITGGKLDISHTLAHRVDVLADLAVKTEPSKSAEDSAFHSITLSKVITSVPELSVAPVIGFEEITATLKWPRLLQTQTLDSLHIKGGEVDVNEVLQRLMKPAPGTTAASALAPPPPLATGWKIDHLTIADTSITLNGIAPGIPPIKFDLNYEARDMPLEPHLLLGRLEPRKIELSQLSLRSPHNPLQEVCVLDTIFVHFTLDGILANRIERVEVINPTLFVGEDLFWYVDYYRKYAAGELDSNAPAPSIVSADDNFAFRAAAQIAAAPATTRDGWSVEELALNGGKIVIAPKGVPLAGIPRPFPFNVTTTLDKGVIEAELEIPGDDYTWEKLKLEFVNLRGRVIYNLPHKNVSNNLTETFQVDKIRYKQLHMDDAFLSVTYDAHGIYGQLGGKAYEGYINGAFNVYLDTTYTWDGWLAGSKVRTTEITQKMTPTYLLLDGVVDAKVIALGNQSEVYQTDLEFKGITPGKFAITTLNSAVDSIPTDVGGWMQDLTRIGIETLRDFQYDRAEASARFYGREGRGKLHLTGPDGSRNIEVNVFDRRWKASSSSTSIQVQPVGVQP